jgi:signal transduction histidine kinase
MGFLVSYVEDTGRKGAALGHVPASQWGSGDSRVRKYLDMARRSTDRAASVMQRLLGLSREQPLAAGPTDLNEIVREMAELLRSSLGRAVSVRTHLGEDVVPTVVDAGGLETSILNLAVNARDAMGACGELTIETSNAFLDEADPFGHHEITPGHYVVIAMSDTGAGMSRELIARACDPFVTGAAGADTGLGLLQVRDFLRQAQGHLAIESEPGLGTTVRLYLPRWSRSASEAMCGSSHIRTVS